MNMLRSLSIAAACCLIVALPARAQDAPPPGIVVRGEAQKSVAPDAALIEAGVSNFAKSARAAAEATNLAMGKVLLELKNAGIEAKDVQTSQLSLQPQYADRPGPSEVTGYVVKNIVSVRVRDIAAVAGILDRLVTAGANEVRGISFTVSNASKLLDEARTEAVADARRKAEIYARAAGLALGAPQSIAEDSGPGVMPMRKMAADFAAGAQVAPGEQTLNVSVTVNWGIKAQ
uniref:SIMPL domain-containing protein n=1 Tax=Rhodopseudomonas palustris (strain DX-1) TaxID=652103 RepID=E6VIZ7_RHOPX